MKRAGIISTVILFLLLGTTAPAYAQHGQKGGEEGNSKVGRQQHQQPAQHQQRAQQTQRVQRTQQPQRVQRTQQPQRVQRTQQPQRVQRANNPAQRQARTQPSYARARSNGRTYDGVHRSGVPQYQGQVRGGWGQSRARSWDSDHRTWVQRGGYVGYRVPQDRYDLYFGSNHYFRMGGYPMNFVSGYPQFQYNGYGVTFADPWPETWPANWYQTDDVYLNYNNDGYYMYNRMRPGPGIAVTLAF